MRYGSVVGILFFFIVVFIYDIFTGQFFAQLQN